MVDPTSLGGLLADLNPNTSAYSDAGATLAGDTEGVEQLSDTSGNDYHFAMGDTDNQPVVKASALNGKNVLTFDGINDGLTCTSLPGQVQTIISVHAPLLTGGHKTIVGADTADPVSIGAWYQKCSNSDARSESAASHTGGGINDTVSAIGSNDKSAWAIYTTTIDHTNKIMRFYKGRVLVSEVTLSSGDFRESGGLGVSIGNGYWANKRVDFYNGDIARVILLDEAIDADTVAGVAAHLEDEYAITPRGDYIFTHFSPSAKRLMVSQGNFTDKWITRPVSYVLDPATQGMRDPDIIYDETLDEFFICHTNAILYEDADSFVIAKSKDLVNWEHVAFIDCSSIADNGADNRVWAPQWYKDPADGKVYVFVSISNSGTHALGGYWLECTDTSTYASFTTPTAMAFNDTMSASNIDWTIIHDGSKYHLFFKDDVSKLIQRAESNSVTGTWDVVTSGDWAGWGASKEGPQVIKIDGGYRMLLDQEGNTYYYSDTSDLTTGWGPLQTMVYDLPFGVELQHGSVFDLRDIYPPRSNAQILRSLDFRDSLPSGVSLTRADSKWSLVNGALVSSGTDIPAFESTHENSLGLAIQQSSTNVLGTTDYSTLGSENVTLTGGVPNSLTGGNDAWLLTEDDNGSNYKRLAFWLDGVSAGTRFCWSGYFKQTSGSTKALFSLAMANKWVNAAVGGYFRNDNVEGISLKNDGGGNFTDISIGHERVNSEWVRYWISGIKAGDGSASFELRSNDWNTTSGFHAGDTSHAIEFFGLQLEQDVSRPSAYLGTDTASDDSVTITDIAGFDQPQGTIVIEHDARWGDLMEAGSFTLPSMGVGRTAIAWNNNTSSLCHNAGEVTTSGPVSIAQAINLLPNANGRIKSIDVYDDRLSPDELVEVTSRDLKATSGQLRLVATRGRLPSSLYASSANTVHLARFPFRMVRSADSVRLVFNNWLSSLAGDDLGSELVIQKCALEYGGTHIPVTFNDGDSTLTMAPGDHDVLSDVIGDIPLDTEGYIRCLVKGDQIPASRWRAETAGECYWIDESDPDIPDVYGEGDISYAGSGTPITEAKGFCPFLVGIGDGPNSVMGVGDSIMEGTGGLAGTGTYLDKMGEALDIPTLLHAVGGTHHYGRDASTRWRSALKYARTMVDAMWRNDAGGILGAVHSIYASARANNVERILRVETFPKSDSSDNWVSDQSNIEDKPTYGDITTQEWIDNHYIDGVISLDGVTDRSTGGWVVDGSPFYLTTDGIHTSIAADDIVAANASSYFEDLYLDVPAVELGSESITVPNSGVIQDGAVGLVIALSDFDSPPTAVTVSDGANSISLGIISSDTSAVTVDMFDISSVLVTTDDMVDWFNGTLTLTVTADGQSASESIAWAPKANWVTVTAVGSTDTVGNLSEGRGTPYPDGTVAYYDTQGSTTVDPDLTLTTDRNDSYFIYAYSDDRTLEVITINNRVIVHAEGDFDTSVLVGLSIIQTSVAAADTESITSVFSAPQITPSDNMLVYYPDSVDGNVLAPVSEGNRATGEWVATGSGNVSTPIYIRDPDNNLWYTYSIDLNATPVSLVHHAELNAPLNVSRYVVGDVYAASGTILTPTDCELSFDGGSTWVTDPTPVVTPPALFRVSVTTGSDNEEVYSQTFDVNGVSDTATMITIPYDLSHVELDPLSLGVVQLTDGRWTTDTDFNPLYMAIPNGGAAVGVSTLVDPLQYVLALASDTLTITNITDIVGGSAEVSNDRYVKVRRDTVGPVSMTLTVTDSNSNEEQVSYTVDVT